MPSRSNLRLASFDGGGPRSFSQLYIMQNLMHRLRWDMYPNDPDKEMLPCDYFDLIGGSDTGGLIAIMFVKLRMSVEEVIAEFGTIVEQAYASDLEPRERTERLKKSLESLLAGRSLPIDAKLRDDGRNAHCAGFALASRSVNAGSRVCLRTYPVRSQPSSTITIIDAALATCASPSEFLPVSFGTGYQRQEFIGAGLAASNPVRYVINEAQTLFGGDSVVASLLSLGSGHPGSISLSPDGGIDALHQLVLEMILDCEQKAQEIQRQFGQVGVYFRFSVEQGMQRGRFPQAQELSSMLAQTESYLTDQETEEKLDRFVHNLKADVGVVSLNRLNRIDGLNTIVSELTARGNNTQYFATSEVRTEVTHTYRCSEMPHLCGMQCEMYGRNGCLTSCTKPMGHDDSEGHQCAAGLHTCGELCSLVQEDGTRLCPRACNLDCRIDHEVHTCDRSLSCPIKCQLCNSYCAVGDHFHALKPNAVHLCGQKHNCDQLCESDGVCEINTTPQSIESTFVGRHATFQYTKYSQEARRLHCIISLGPDQLKHDGSHVHSNDPNPFHYCEERCRYCGYYCMLPLGHSQPEHDTSHGSMAQTEWFIEGDDDAILEVHGRKYATGDSGAPMLCSLVCEALGRHVHVDSCRPDEDGNCVGADLEHIDGSGKNKDWITHRLYWARSGFRDPYSRKKQDDFALCDYRCPGPEHDADDTHGAVPSYCTLPLFHGTPDPSDVPPLGHVSNGGHAYQCKNPALMRRAFHIFFVLDRSASMTWTDRQPLPNSPVTRRIVQLANNRFGAVISSLHGFWTAREAALRRAANAGQRRDAYSIISFDHNVAVTLSNDTTSDSDQLLEKVLGDANIWGGTNYTAALDTVQAQMVSTWTTDRSPVVIFVAAGGCDVEDATIYGLCRTAARLGKPLSFHSVSFGEDGQSHCLRRMAAIAAEVYDDSPADPLAPAGVNPCTFSTALDTVQLLSLAESLKNPRAALSRVP